jgi:hypothetical protein
MFRGLPRRGGEKGRVSPFGFRRGVAGVIGGGDSSMAKTSDGLSSVVQQIRFVGRGSGAVKTLSGFKKNHHSVPDAVNASTTAFLAKLCAGELAEEAEAFFQRAKAGFGYKRKDLSLDVTSPSAVLTAKDFTLEWTYSLDETDPAAWMLMRTLHGIERSDFLGTPECAEVFGGLFSELVFALTKGVSVEAVIDAVEGLEPDEEKGDEETEGLRSACEHAALRVDYPSDCGHCVLSVEGVSAMVKFEGAELSMVFPRSGAPQELLDGFAAVRAAFSLTKNKALAGLLK